MSTDTQYYVVSSLLVFLSTFLINFVYNKLNKTRPKLAPSPPTIPVIGHLHLLWPSFHKSLQNLSTQYGQIFSLHLGFTRCRAGPGVSLASPWARATPNPTATKRQKKKKKIYTYT